MNLNLDTFAPAIRAIEQAGVPFLEQGLTAVLSGVAGPFGMLVSPALNELWPAINAKFDLAPDAEPTATAAAIQTDPDAKAKLQAVADAHHDLIQQAMAKDALDEKNVESARTTEIARYVNGAWYERAAPLILALCIVLGFFGVLILFALGKANSSDTIMVVMATTLAGAFGALVNYYYGSSIGSKTKTDMIAAGLPPAKRSAR